MMRSARLPTALLLIFCLTASCRHTPRPVPPPPDTPAPPTVGKEDLLDARRGPRVDTVRTEPKLRIRIARSLSNTVIAAGGSVSVGPGQRDLGKARTYTFQAPLRISHDKQGFVLAEPSGKRTRWRLRSLLVRANAGRVLIDSHPYPGTIELVAKHDKNRQSNGSFDAVNHVAMEAYLPGVLSKELYPGWDEEAYRAQAIAARSYAIWEMGLPVRRASHFDLEASQASQAYVGDKASPKARDAVAATHGQVLIFNGRILPAFYSSCSGGSGQDADAAWPGKVDSLAPLRGRDHGRWGSISSKHRWGPIKRDRATLSKRLAAWGKANKHPVASLGMLDDVQVTASNSVGRPTRLRLTDTAGHRYNLYAEKLRLASNFKTPNLPTIDLSNMAFSSHAVYTVAADTVTITGQGFGHGVGLCQFGAQHMASRGNDHRRILAFYYPGTKLQKAY